MNNIEENDSFNLNFKDIWVMFTSHIRLFIICIGIACIIAIGYLYIQKSTFSTEYTVLIKDDMYDNTALTGIVNINNLGFNAINLDDEINILKSNQVLAETIKELKLNDKYSRKISALKWAEFYKNSPIEISLDGISDNDNISFTVKILPNNEVELSDIKLKSIGVGLIEQNNKIKGKFSGKLKTDLGFDIIVNKTADFKNDFENKKIKYSKTNFDKTFTLLSEALKITKTEKKGATGKDAITNILNLEYTDLIPQRSRDILSSIIQAYNSYWSKHKLYIIDNAYNSLEERLIIAEEELSIAERKIADFKSSFDLPDPSTVTSLNIARSTANARILLDLNNQLLMLEYITDIINDSTAEYQLLPTKIGFANADIESQINSYNGLLSQRTNLLQNSNEKNPYIIEIVEKSLFLKDKINKTISNFINTVNIKIVNINNVEAIYKKELVSAPANNNLLIVMTRELNLKESLYLSLLQKFENIKLMTNSISEKCHLLVSITKEPTPSTKDKLMILFLAAFLGFCIPAAYVFLLLITKNVILSKDDLEILNTPFIGVLPLFNVKVFLKYFKIKARDKNNSIEILVEDNNSNPINEAFRMVRTNLDFIEGINDANKVIMLTSFEPKSGKSFTAINLAMSMALKGAKTIVIDADMRQATLSECVNSPNLGLVNYLSGKTNSIEDIIIKQKLHPNLDVIAVGALPHNPTELLITNNFENLIAALKSEYEYIFIDSSAHDILADATIINKHSNICIFVLRTNLTNKGNLKELNTLYENKQYNNICALLNAV